MIGQPLPWEPALLWRLSVPLVALAGAVFGVALDAAVLVVFAVPAAFFVAVGCWTGNAAEAVARSLSSSTTPCDADAVAGAALDFLSSAVVDAVVCS